MTIQVFQVLMGKQQAPSDDTKVTIRCEQANSASQQGKHAATALNGIFHPLNPITSNNYSFTLLSPTLSPEPAARHKFMPTNEKKDVPFLAPPQPPSSHTLPSRRSLYSLSLPVNSLRWKFLALRTGNSCGQGVFSADQVLEVAEKRCYTIASILECLG